MNRDTRYLILCLPFLLEIFLPSALLAQGGKREYVFGSDPEPSQWSIGPFVSILRNYHSGTLYPADSTCSLEYGSPTLSYGFGVSMEIRPVVNGQSGRWGIIPYGSYEHRPAEVLATVNETAYSSEVTYDLLNMGIRYAYDMIAINHALVGIAGGPSFQYVLKREVDSGDSNDGTIASSCFTSLFEDLPTTRFSLLAGLQMELGIFNNQWCLVSGLFFDYGLSEWGSDASTPLWRTNSLILQIDLRKRI